VGLFLLVAAVVWLPTNGFAAQSDERLQFADFNALYEKWFGVYELRAVGLRNLLKTILPIVVFFLAWIGYLFYRQHQERSLAHVAMAASRDLLRTIVDTAPVRIFWKDNNLRYLGCNALFAKDAGVETPKDIIGMDDFQMPWGKDAVGYRSDDVTVMVSGVSKLFYEEQQNTADGRTIWLRTSKVRLTNQNHETMGVLGIYEDVTKRKQADERLRQLSIVFEQSPASVVITDLKARIQYVNPRFTEVTGYSAAEVIGKNPSMLQSQLTAKEVYADMWKILTQGLVWHGELINQRKDGQAYWEDSQIAPVRNAQGLITHYVAIKTDVTERVRSNEKIQAMMLEQQAILQNKLIGIVTVRDRKIVWANPAFEQMLGYAAGELAGTPTRKNYPSDDAYLVFGAAAYPVLSAGGVFRLQIEQVRKDGTRIWVDVSGSMLDPNTGESLWGFIDISENKRLEAVVREQSFLDPLTQLANRRLLNDRLNQAMAANLRQACYGAVLALDLDNFKPLNDKHGHLAGDLLLIEVAKRLSLGVRQVDTVARVGGDEFVVLLAQLSTDKNEATAQAHAIAEKIHGSLAEPYSITLNKEGSADFAVEHHCSASIGMALFFNHDLSPERVLNRADAAMYQAKAAGRNTIRYENAL
jgi:diguanylate cyclase (GGDEF)-like protein/PAS domain S-box-containing protein